MTEAYKRLGGVMVFSYHLADAYRRIKWWVIDDALFLFSRGNTYAQCKG